MTTSGKDAHSKALENSGKKKRRERKQQLCGSLDRRRVLGRVDTCIHTTEPFHSLPETITVLLIGYTPVQDVFGVKKLKIKIKKKAKSSIIS